jgi:magnesium-transporting ATPase (P-type)
MTTPNADGTAEDLVTAAGPDERPVSTKAKNEHIRVSPAVLDTAGKDGDGLLGHLRTTHEGLTQTEAEERRQAVGPNEVAQERRQNWAIRFLEILRNPLVILLAILSTVAFASGDVRAGTVMMAMVALSVALRFLQEARADAAAAATPSSTRWLYICIPCDHRRTRIDSTTWRRVERESSNAPAAPAATLRRYTRITS